MSRSLHHGALATLVWLTNAYVLLHADEPGDPTTADGAGRVNALEQQVRSIETHDLRQEFAALKQAAKVSRMQQALADVADIPAQDLRVGNNEKMRYFLIGPRPGAEVPKAGYKLVVVMPGGDGGEDFHPYVRRIFKHAVSDKYLFAQPVACKWTESQQIVWPTRDSPVEGQQFSTEDFVEAVVGDVARRYRLDKKSIFTLSRSSGGPAAYAISLAETTAVTGSYIAMSVFKPDYLPPLKNARNRAYFIDHSPDDRMCPFRMAEAAKKSLEEHGARVRLNVYQGGHGWHGDVYARIKSGIEWLEGCTSQK